VNLTDYSKIPNLWEMRSRSCFVNERDLSKARIRTGTRHPVVGRRYGKRSFKKKAVKKSNRTERRELVERGVRDLVITRGNLMEGGGGGEKNGWV